MTIRSRMPRVLDLFAGTGALGIEAVSRGAEFALFVDNGAEARALLRNNVEALGLGGVTKVYRRDADNLGPAHPVEPFSLVFLDPPYGMKLAEKALASLRDGGWLTPGALLVVEEAKAAEFARLKASRNWSGAPTTIRNSCFCAARRHQDSRRPPCRSHAFHCDGANPPPTARLFSTASTAPCARPSTCPRRTVSW